MDIEKVIQAGIAKMCEFEFGNDRTPYLRISYHLFIGKDCFVCHERIRVGQYAIEWETGREEVVAISGSRLLHAHLECFLGVFFWNIAQLEEV